MWQLRAMEEASAELNARSSTYGAEALPPSPDDGMTGLQRARLAISKLNQGLEADASDISGRLVAGKSLERDASALTQD